MLVLFIVAFPGNDVCRYCTPGYTEILVLFVECHIHVHVDTAHLATLCIMLVVANYNIIAELSTCYMRKKARQGHTPRVVSYFWRKNEPHCNRASARFVIPS